MLLWDTEAQHSEMAAEKVEKMELSIWLKETVLQTLAPALVQDSVMQSGGHCGWCHLWAGGPDFYKIFDRVGQ